MRSAGVISGVRVSHERATVDEIESASSEDVRSVIETLLAHEGVSEAFALQTCNRAEAYVVTDAQAAGRRALADFAPHVRDGVVVQMSHEESLRHLMRVAAGLESLVLGEDQILGQLKRAFEDARGAGGIGRVLDDAVTKAVHVGERARTETAINEGAVSLGSAAVRLAESESETALAGSTALVVGAGEMGALAAKSLADAGVAELVVANRTVPHAEHVAAEVDVPARAIPLAAVDEAVEAADVVISATGSPDYVLSHAHVETGGETTLIDIAQPRDVDPGVDAVPGVVVHDIDGLEAVTDETRERRREAAERVEAMIDEEFERLLESFKRKRADQAISGMYEAAERVKGRELDTALSKLEAQGELTDEQRETVSALADALVGQLLSAPTKSLREAAVEDDWDTIQTAMTLFDPDFGGEEPSLGAPSGPREGRPENVPEDVPDDADVPQHVLESLSDD
ncbi:glutamyl-tRNA reductase [Halogeometricum pallidum JCM 14848]|uniref:Glutamyl-tRNA reductase n=1 Tax=Halogeometricum pallidum JCM 14848 TaxID=1227487 RepID=M0DCZ5_HALPD|nr:glutamyl-tRNA reductase [Halogeometricum pallidum]ELZ33361.1 glutamyl-tRNA reductase [Halogeometricum pallidum JCM 14848]